MEDIKEKVLETLASLGMTGWGLAPADHDGFTCTACIDACPQGYLTGAEWRDGIARAQVIDAFACSRRMEVLGEPIGHKHSCGLCLLACPLGVRKATNH